MGAPYGPVDPGGPLLIVHLSDIHFKRADFTTVHDPNFFLRSEILRDLAAFKGRLGFADLVVVSGDVAFAGQHDEFDFATEWLKEACEACGADFRNVFVVPGNHDVDRKVADEDLVQLIHQDIKAAENHQLDARLRKYLTKPEAAALLYKSLDAYNNFAQQFFCDMLPAERTRVERSFELNDGSKLKLWGINSAFVSSSADDERQLFVDPATFQITREAGTVNMVVTHHHPTWLRQRQRLEDHFGAVAQIQFFGHVHTNRIHPEMRFVRFHASALHPDQAERKPEPGYNIIQVEVERENGQRWLHVKAHVRVWQESPPQFHAKVFEEETFFEHRIKLEPWEASDVEEPRSPPPQATGSTTIAPPPGIEDMSRLRDLGIRFYGLTFSQKSAIAGRLELLEDSDMAQPDFERFRRVFFRASERNKLAELQRAIEEVEERLKQ